MNKYFRTLQSCMHVQVRKLRLVFHHRAAGWHDEQTSLGRILQERDIHISAISTAYLAVLAETETERYVIVEIMTGSEISIVPHFWLQML